MGDSTPHLRTSIESELAEVRVNPTFHEGVRVTEINQVGKAQKRYLTLSHDKFHVFITTKRLEKGKLNSSLLFNSKPLIQRIRNISTSSTNAENDETGRREDGKIIDISSIDRIQLGQNTMQFEYFKNELKSRNPNRSPKASAVLTSQNSDDENRSFSIIFNGDRSLAVITNSEKDFNTILHSLTHLMDTYRGARLCIGKDALLLRYIWIDIDKDQSNHINLSELNSLLNRINFSEKNLKKTYKEFCRKIGKISKTRGLNFSQCVLFFHMIRRDTWTRKPIDRIWDDLFGVYRSNGDMRVKISAEMFLRRFLHAKQRQYDTTLDTVKLLFSDLNQLEIANVASNISDGEDKYIDKSRLEEFLNSRDNDIFDPQKEDLNPMTMREPLSHYWINSSHNTYLLGDQLTSQASVEMYLVALHRGCRCVEIDIWDGPSDPYPVPLVTHGLYSLTSSISFADIIDAINRFLICNPDSYPIIISLEIRCSVRYQEVMADDLVRILGKRLFVPTHQNLFEELPSPESLKGKVILKGHRSDVYEDDLDSSYSGIEDTDDTQALRLEVEPKAKAKVKICPALSKITFFHGSKYKDFSQTQKNPPFQMHSFSDKRFTKVCKNRRDWIKYNQTNMSRIFPEGTRVLSDNFNPIIGWSAGCQLIALNFQTTDHDLRINDGRFRANGNCGYVLKPQNMLQDRYIETFSEPMNLKVQVICGSRLPKPRGRRHGECIDPCVHVTLWDVNPQDGKEIRENHITNTIYGNGFFPIFDPDKSTYEFSVQNQNVAMLQFSVLWSAEFIASAAIPVSCIRNGYRSVQLFDANNAISGAFDFANLLVEVEMERTLAEI